MGNDFSSCSLSLTGPDRLYNFIHNAPFYIEAGTRNCIFTQAQAESLLLLFQRARRAMVNPPWSPSGTRFQELAGTGAFRDAYWRFISTSLEFDTVQGIFDVGLEGTGFPLFESLSVSGRLDNASAILLQIFLIRTASADRANGLFSLLTSNLGRYVFRRVEGGTLGALDPQLFSSFFNGVNQMSIIGDKAVSLNGKKLVVGAQPFILQRGALVQLVPINICAGLVQGVDSSGPIIEAGPNGVLIDGGIYMSINNGGCAVCQPTTSVPLGMQRLIDYMGLPFENYEVVPDRRADGGQDWQDYDVSSDSEDVVEAGIQTIPLFGNFNNGNPAGAAYQPVEENFLGTGVPFANPNFGPGYNAAVNDVFAGRAKRGGCAGGACTDKGGEPSFNYTVKNRIVTDATETVDDLLKKGHHGNDNSDKGRPRRGRRRCDCRKRDCRICGDFQDNPVQFVQRNTIFAYIKNINRITEETQHHLRRLFKRIGTGNFVPPPVPLPYNPAGYNPAGYNRLY